MVSNRAWSLMLLLGASACGSVSATPDGGHDAAAGTSGAAGAAGAAGTSGTSGASGASGAAGSSGAAGTTGAAGSASPGGATGSAGAGGTGAGGSGGGGGTFVSDILPGPFTLMMPTNGNPAVDVMPLLSWTVAANALTYDVEVSTSSTFEAASVTKVTGVVGNGLTWKTALTPGQIYFWRVNAVALGGFSTTATNAPFSMSVPVSVGASPHGVAVTSSGKVVVSNDTMPGSVTLLDLATLKTEAIAVSNHPGVVAVTPDGKTALVPHVAPNEVSIIDLVSKTVTGTIAPPCVATTLYGLAIKADGSAAVMPDVSGGCINDVLDVIPLPGSAISKGLPLGTSATAFGVAVTPDGATALVTRGVTATSMRRVDLGTGVVTTIAGTSSTFGVAITPDGATALVTSGPGDTVKPIVLATGAVGTPIAFESNSEVCNVAIAPDGKHAVVVGSFNVAVLSLAPNAVVRMPAVAGRCVAIAPDGSRAFVTGAGVGGKLYVIKLP
jgi:DNA-binding beta-propeller fold protein YncE